MVCADLGTFALPEIVVCPLVLFRLTIVLSVLLRFVDSDYPFDIFKLFLHLKMTFRLLVFFSKGMQCIQFDWTMNKLYNFRIYRELFNAIWQ